ncbi:MAG: DUF835 domain-containing protein [Thermoplasmata archaeon]
MRAFEELSRHKKLVGAIVLMSILAQVAVLNIGHLITYGSDFVEDALAGMKLLQIPLFVLFGVLVGLLMSVFYIRAFEERTLRREEAERADIASTERDILETLLREVFPVVEDKMLGKWRLSLELERGRTYLSFGLSPEGIYEAFVEHISRGIQGLIVTRQNPSIVKKEWGLEKTPIVWLTTNRGPRCVGPTSLEMLYKGVAEFAVLSKDGIILLEGIEYLAVHNGFRTILKALHTIQDSIATSKCRLLLWVDPTSFTSRQLSLLARYCYPFNDSSQASSQMTEFSAMEAPKVEEQPL